MRWMSRIKDLGPIKLPQWAGVRVLMMPFHLHDIEGTLPQFVNQWIGVVSAMRSVAAVPSGLAYLTIDERDVPIGACHRRPGLHVDGWRDDIGGGMWGGSSWAGGFDGHGMVMAASHLGSVGYEQEFIGEPLTFGDCTHLRDQIRREARLELAAARLWWLSPLTVHESIAASEFQRRQFVRLSLPSSGAWPVSCTPNPLGIDPGKVCGPRPEGFTAYAPLPELPRGSSS